MGSELIQTEHQLLPKSLGDLGKREDAVLLASTVKKPGKGRFRDVVLVSELFNRRVLLSN